MTNRPATAFSAFCRLARPYSESRWRLIVCTLRVIINHAVEDELVDVNPAAMLGKFSEGRKKQREATALTREETELFLEAAKDFCSGYHPLFLTALRAGLRRGELVALWWGDVQFGESEGASNRYILVQHNYVQGKFTTPKSKKPRRVDLSRQLRQVLIKLRDQRLLEAFTQGKTSIPDGLVFPSRQGNILDPDNLVHYYFLPCVEQAELRKIRFHDLLHTFGSHLIQQGAPLPYVKEQMGHISIQVTVDTYGHLVPGGDIRRMDCLDSKTSPQPNATYTQPAVVTEEGDAAEVVEKNGEPWGSRTPNLLIKSQLLCQLS